MKDFIEEAYEALVREKNIDNKKAWDLVAEKADECGFLLELISRCSAKEWFILQITKNEKRPYQLTKEQVCDLVGYINSNGE